jgi:hypothetical protein
MRALTVAALSLWVAGCTASNVDKYWGMAVTDMTALQTADPTGVPEGSAVEGLDAPTSERVAKRYYEGQEQQETRQAPTILIQGQ